MSERMEKAIERLADVLEAQEARLAEMEEERGPTFMEYLASGARVNEANLGLAEAATESHKTNTEIGKIHLEAEKRIKKMYDHKEE